jgi:hypothetical protein
MKLTRRQLAAAALAPAAMAAPQQPAAPKDDLEAARERMRNNIAAVKSIAVPMATEPSFEFRA